MISDVDHLSKRALREVEKGMIRGLENLGSEIVCCLLVLDSVTSTPQWIRQPEPRGVR